MMPDLLLELFSEEIPARMQAQAAAELKRLVTHALVERGLTYEGALGFATPRRLALHVAGLPAHQPDSREERKGPRVGAPAGAIQGFLKSTGLASIEAATIARDKKGDFYIAVIERPGQASADVIAAILPGIIKTFPWPKSMRWGSASAAPESLRWVRPLQSILCTFGSETEEPEIVPFTVGDLTAGDSTAGHRFMAPARFRVKRFDDYVSGLRKAKVVLDPELRQNIIRHDARQLTIAQGLEVIEDDALLAEVAGLVEWPVVLLGRFDPAFLAMPPEVIRATIRANQKCFVTRALESGRLADRFVLVANIEAPDGGAAIVAGNERVVRARLADAKFFFETDLSLPLADRALKLSRIVFHEKLGTQSERVERIATLARHLAPQVGAAADAAERAARLAKADLVSEMVGEFPELQGLMGRYYAAAQGESLEVAEAIEDHYKPQGPSDLVPKAPVSIAVALADKLDTLVGFWAIDEKPTGSKDPYALRRAALGMIRIITENALRIKLSEFQAIAVQGFVAQNNPWVITGVAAWAAHGGDSNSVREDLEASFAAYRASQLDVFFAERLKNQLKQQGARHDLIDAVFALGGQDDLLMIVRRVEALGRFLDAEDGKTLLAGYRRAANILRAEEKKEGAGAFSAAFDPASLVLPDERALAETLQQVESAAASCVEREDFEGAMRALARLRGPVDAFFERVTVNAEAPALRLNRLRLLDALRRTTLTVADFSKVGG